LDAPYSHTYFDERLMTPLINLFFVLHNFSGATTYCQALSEYLSGHDRVKMHIVHLFSDKPEFSAVETKDGTEIFIPSPPAGTKITTKYYDLCAKLLFAEYHHLSQIVFHFNTNYCVDMAKTVSRLFHCNIVYTLHFLESDCTYYTYLKIPREKAQVRVDAQQQQILDLADKVICVTQFAADVIREFYSVKPKKIHVIHNGKTNTATGIPQSLEAKRSQKAMLGFRPDEKIILYAGRLEERKGVDCLIEAFKNVLTQFPNARLVIAGGGSYDDYLQHCKGLYGKITFTGNLEQGELYRFYRVADVGVIPSRYEQCSYIAIEMMQYGLPMVINDVPGLNELFDEKQNAQLCPLRESEHIPFSLEPDIAVLATQVCELLVHPEFAANLGSQAQKKVQESFSLEAMGLSTLSLYNELNS